MSVSVVELAERVEAHGFRCTPRLTESFLREWESQGVAEELAGRWRLTARGQAMFGGWAAAIDHDDQDEAA